MLPYFKIVKQYERLGVFRLGKFTGMRKPGVVILFLGINTSTKLDIREEVININRQTNITRDNAPIDIDFLVYMRIVENDAERALLEVVDYHAAVEGIATTTLRAVIGEMSRDDVRAHRARTTEELRHKLDQ